MKRKTTLCQKSPVSIVEAMKPEFSQRATELHQVLSASENSHEVTSEVMSSNLYFEERKDTVDIGQLGHDPNGPLQAQDLLEPQPVLKK